MLLDDAEVRIMADALQPQLRVSQPDTRVRELFAYFFAARHLAGTKILELGPGQYDFTRLATAAGAAVVTIDHDPAVVALGRKRGYDARLADVRTFDWSAVRGTFDGLFVRNSIAAQWFRDPKPVEALANNICSVVKPAGWAWLAPWNRFRGVAPALVETLLAAQRETFKRNGCTVIELTALTCIGESDYDWYELFLRGLDAGPQRANPRFLLDYVVESDNGRSPTSVSRAATQS